MKKFLALMLACLMLLSLCACGEADAEATTTAPQTTGAAQDTRETTGTTDAQDPKALAESCIGGSVEDLYALIGQPESAEYAPSCLNPEAGGEDGMLYYDGFVVYTYKEGDTETVDYVE